MSHPTAAEPAAAPGSRPAPCVLHLASGQMWGGVEAMLVELALHATDDVARVNFAFCADAEPAARLRDATGIAATVLPTPRLSRPLSVHRARAALRAELARVRPDAVVLHAPWVQAIFGTTVRRAGCASLLYLHDAPSQPGVVDRFARWSRPRAAAANSAYTAALARAQYGAGLALQVIAPPLSPPQLPEGVRARYRATHGAGEQTAVILQVGRLTPYKGQETLVRAAALLPRDADWVVWIVGGAQRPEERDYAAGLDRLVQELGLADRVRLLGAQAEVRGLLEAADVFVHLNGQPEAFGLAVVEAMYAGLPVVAAASGGTLEIVTPECGILLPPDDASSLAGALSHLLASPATRRALGAAGPARARALCDPARQTRALHELALSSRRRVA